jgi:hypothetical protein
MISNNTITANPAAPPAITNDTLRRLARTDSNREQGILSDKDQAVLVMYLPEICNELLERRSAALTITTKPMRSAALLANARAVLFSKGEITAAELADACKTLIALSGDPCERTAAHEVLSQIGIAA